MANTAGDSTGRCFCQTLGSVDSRAVRRKVRAGIFRLLLFWLLSCRFTQMIVASNIKCMRSEL